MSNEERYYLINGVSGARVLARSAKEAVRLRTHYRGLGFVQEEGEEEAMVFSVSPSKGFVVLAFRRVPPGWDVYEVLGRSVPFSEVPIVSGPERQPRKVLEEFLRQSEAPDTRYTLYSTKGVWSFDVEPDGQLRAIEHLPSDVAHQVEEEGGGIQLDQEIHGAHMSVGESTMIKLTYYAQIELAEDGYWLVRFLDCEGCTTFGDTLEEAREMAKEALELWLETHLDEGQAPPRPMETSGEPIVVSEELAERVRECWTKNTVQVTQENANYLAERSGVNVGVNYERTYFIVRHDPNLEPLYFEPLEDDTIEDLLKCITVTTGAMTLARDEDMSEVAKLRQLPSSRGSFPRKKKPKNKGEDF